MFIVKGIGLGFGMFLMGLALYIASEIRFTMKNFPPPPKGSTIGIDFVTLIQHNSTWFLMALVACLLLGTSIVALWPHRVIS